MVSSNWCNEAIGGVIRYSLLCKKKILKLYFGIKSYAKCASNRCNEMINVYLILTKKKCISYQMIPKS